jgi:uncharacterized protein (TIGR00255 family)
MTAFGRTQKEASGYTVTLEIRALNSKVLDILLRLPKTALEFEESLRKQVSQTMRRGRIEIFIQIESKLAEARAPRIDPALARYYWQQLQNLYRQLPGMDPPKLEHLLSIPHLYEARENNADKETLKTLLSSALEEALLQINDMRCQEGASLLKDLLERLESLKGDLGLVEGRKGAVIEEYQRRLRERIQELLGDTPVDENRMLQEIAVLAERSDINEETVRLRSHLDQLKMLLTGSKPADGRRLDFLMQELHREVNTIGCKTSDLDTLQAIVRMKSEIGSLKEQVQNIE